MCVCVCVCVCVFVCVCVCHYSGKGDIPVTSCLPNRPSDRESLGQPNLAQLCLSGKEVLTPLQ